MRSDDAYNTRQYRDWRFQRRWKPALFMIGSLACVALLAWVILD